MIIFCPKCAQKIDVDNQYYGSSAQCPTCGTSLVISDELIWPPRSPVSPHRPVMPPPAEERRAPVPPPPPLPPEPYRRPLICLIMDIFSYITLASGILILVVAAASIAARRPMYLIAPLLCGAAGAILGGCILGGLSKIVHAAGECTFRLRNLQQYFETRR